MEEKKYIDDLKDIKDIMNRSSRFISLSGLSGVFAGIFALTGAFFAYRTVYVNQDYLGYRQAILTYESITTLLIIAIATLFPSIIAGILLTSRKVRRDNQRLWDLQTKRLLINLLIPLTTGGIICLMLLFQGHIGLIAPLTLIFYGLALVNASKYTLSEIRSLGIVEIVIGLIAMYFIGYGLLFWSLGFGILHIVYGIIMQIRHGS
ncbi:hypothetical protein ACFLU5_03480 [Bacteroidota bacterium]